MQTIKVKFRHSVDIDTETRNKLSDNGWTIDYCEKENNNPHNMELTELEKKHAFSSDFFVNLMLLPNKYLTLNEEYKRAKECYSNADSEEEKQIIRLKLQWLHDALLVIEKESCNKTYKPLDIPKHSDANYSLREAQECIKKKWEDIQSHSRKISLDLVDDVKSFNIITDASFTLKGNEEHGIPLNQNAEVEWHMDRVDAIREKQKTKEKNPKPVKNRGEFKHPSTRTINCIGVEAAYDTPEGREYRRKQNEEFEEFKRNNC